MRTIWSTSTYDDHDDDDDNGECDDECVGDCDGECNTGVLCPDSKDSKANAIGIAMVKAATNETGEPDSNFYVKCRCDG